MTDDLLRQLLAEVRGLRADLRQAPAGIDHADLLRELRADFGVAPFTARGLLQLVEDYPDGDLGAVLRRVVNLDDATAAVQLGRLLAAMPGLERAGNKRGVRLYRLRG